MRSRLRSWAEAVRRDAVALWLAARDPRVPWPAKAVALAVAGYALSPIDLIPDFIPVLGLLDDLVIVPAGILLARRLIPPKLLDEHRRAADRLLERPRSRAASVAIVLVWIALSLALALYAWRAGWSMFQTAEAAIRDSTAPAAIGATSLRVALPLKDEGGRAA
jgi:uncharacterized membrane protein YkvA (DUF1232 family)